MVNVIGKNPNSSSGSPDEEKKLTKKEPLSRFMPGQEKEIKEFDEKVLEINRTSKKTKGGNRFSFSALVIVGNRKGSLGLGVGKANVVSEAVKKAIRKAKIRLFSIELVGNGQTIAHPIFLKKGAVKILLKPAPSGTGVRVGGPLRAIFEAAGVKNITGRLLGSRNKKGIAYTAIQALKNLHKSTSKINF